MARAFQKNRNRYKLIHWSKTLKILPIENTLIQKTTIAIFMIAIVVFLDKRRKTFIPAMIAIVVF